MTSEQLYINDILIELAPRAVSRTLQVNNFREVKDRQANYSNNIKIPKTRTNTETFEFLGLIGSTTRLPYEQVDVKYVLDGIELISVGKGIFKSTTDYYNLVIYDGNISMSDLLGNSTLADLDYSSYNHDLTYMEFLDSFTNTSGYIYGIKGTSAVNINNAIPSFYIHTLFDMIFTQVGYTISGAILTNTDYKSRVTTADIGFDNTLTVDVTNVYTQAHSNSPSVNTGSKVYTDILLDTKVVAADGVYKIDFTGTGIITVTSGNDYSVQVKRNGILQDSIAFTSGAQIDSYSLYAENTDSITVNIRIESEFDGSIWLYAFTENFTTEISLDESYYEIAFEDIMGSTKQIDFVKDVMQRFNLSFRKTRNVDEIEFLTSEALLTDTTNSEDWSEKFSKKTGESYSSNFAQDNIFKYKYDESGDDFADGHLLVNNTNAPTSKTILTSIFKASLKVGSDYVLNYWNEDNEPEQDGLRIFKITTASDPSFAFRLNSSSNYITISKTVAYLDFSDLSYQEELDNNYGTFKQMLDDYKIITVECNLSIVDIYNVDFFKLKSFSQLGRTYYLNRILNYKSNRVTKVELIQIPI